MDALNFLAGFAYFLVSVLIFFALIRKNHFGIYFLAIEYFYIVGFGIFPMALAWGLVEPPDFVAHTPSILTPVHILFYAAGAITAFLLQKNRFSWRLVRFSVGLNVDPDKSFNVIFFVSFLFFVLYVAFVGVEQSVLGASFARSGDFDYFDDGNKYAYLRRPMMLGILISLYASYFIFQKKSPWAYMLFCGVIGISIYAVTVSRYALLQLIAVPSTFFALYLIGRGAVSKILGFAIILFMFVFSIFVLSYGKLILYQIGSYLLYGTPINLNVDGNQGAGWNAFSHLYYSIDAGVRSFSEHGLVVYKDLLLSPLGFLPGGVFESLGIGSLSYHSVLPEDRFSCVNTLAVTNGDGCYIPPYFPGASAYFIPLVGGFLFGFLRFYLYSAVSRAWTHLSDAGKGAAIPVLLIFFYFIDQMMLLIPSTISLTVFSFIVSMVAVKSGVLRYRRRQGVTRQ